MAIPCCVDNIAIAKITKLSVEDFKNEYLNIGKPVIIEDAIDSWPAREWTLESLSERVGQNVVHIRHNTNCEEYRMGRQYAIRQTTFGEYIDDLKVSNSRSMNSYMAVQNIRKAFPELEDDVKIPEYVGKVHGGPFLWIAHKGHYEYCHFDPDDGFLIVLNGSKQVRLFECDFLHNLYPNALGTKGRTVQSRVNCDDPDVDEHPLFLNTRCHYGVVHSGEMLYIPAFWWHQVTSLEVTISINIFWGDAGDNVYLSKVMTNPIWPCFRHWLLNIVEQNAAYQSFNRTLSRLPEAIRNFLMTQWHETVTEDQMRLLVETILDHLNLERLPENDSCCKHPPPIKIRGLLWRS